jgi:hypothetical protein
MWSYYDWEESFRGFVINGENVDDISGNSVSTAGDINGDGLNDLIVGARGKLKAGKFYGVYRRKTTTTTQS